jgi:hypothetical protein
MKVKKGIKRNHFVHEFTGIIHLLKPTLKLIRRYTAQLNQVTQETLVKKNSHHHLVKKNLALKDLQGLIEANVSKLMNLVSIFILLGTVTIAAIGIYVFKGRSNTTYIKVELKTHFISVRTFGSVDLHSNPKPPFGSHTYFSMRNGFLTLDYPYSYPDTIPQNMDLKPLGPTPIIVREISIPDSSVVTLDTPLGKDLYLTVNGERTTRGFIPLEDVVLYSPNRKDSMIYSGYSPGTGINFESTPTHTLTIALAETLPTEWSPIYIRSVNFGVRKETMEEYGIESGKITLLETGDSVKLDKGDLLKIDINHPVKLITQFRDGAIYIQFTGAIDSLYAGPEIFGESDNNNRMPKLWKVHRELLSIFLIILASALPVLLTFIFRSRKAL